MFFQIAGRTQLIMAIFESFDLNNNKNVNLEEMRKEIDENNLNDLKSDGCIIEDIMLNAGINNATRGITLKDLHRAFGIIIAYITK